MFKKKLAVISALAFLTLPALAGGPSNMPPVDFPISITSIATAVAVAGGTILIAYLGIKIGFALVRLMADRSLKGVRA